MARIHTFNTYYKLYTSHTGYFTEKKAKEWVHTAKCTWEVFLRTRNEWEEGESSPFLPAFLGKPYEAVIPTLDVKIEVYDIRRYGDLKYLGYDDDFKSGNQKIGWGLEARVIAKLSAGDNAHAEWKSPLFGWLKDTPQEITVTTDQLIKWAEGTLNKWQKEAEEERKRKNNFMWGLHMHWGTPVPEGAPKPLKPLMAMANKDFREMVAGLLEDLQGLRWYADDPYAHLAHIERLLNFFVISDEEKKVFATAKSMALMDRYEAATLARGGDPKFARAWKVAKEWLPS